MPVADAYGGVGFQSLAIDDPGADVGSPDKLPHAYVGRCGSQSGEGQCFAVGEPDPYQVAGQQKAVAARLSGAHHADVEVREQVTGAGVHADIVSARSYSAVGAGKPEIWTHREI